MNALEITLLYLLAAVLGVVVFRSLHLPPMLGYLSVGVLIGPNALALAQQDHTMQYLGEFGVVFLMFVIGLEFNLSKLKLMRAHVFGLGFAQVALTLLIVPLVWVALTHLVPAQWMPGWHMDWKASVALAGALAMSSTAIVLKLMADSAQLQTEHGRRVVGVLLFQDLAVVPLLVIIPALSTQPQELLRAVVFACVKGLVLVVVLLIGGRWLMHWWLRLVAKRQSEELFVLNVLLVTLTLAWLTERAGLTLALGAFIAGMLISETPYKHQVESEIRPFHDILLGLFFITIGMLLDWRMVFTQWWLVLVLTLLPILFKLVLVTVLCAALGASRGVAMRTGLYLAQAGEFGFVLLTLASSHRLVPPELLNPILAGMVLSMLMTPFVMMHAGSIVNRLVRSDWMMQSMQLASNASKTLALKNHVIVCGYGRSGQNLVSMLRTQGVCCIAMDSDPELIEHMQDTGHGDSALAARTVVYGDCTKAANLHAIGLMRAKALVVSFADTRAAHHIIDMLKREAPQLPTIVRTRDDQEMEALLAAGATEVVPDMLEGSLMLASHALTLVGIPMRQVLRAVQVGRDDSYRSLRNYYDEDDIGHH